MDMQQNLRRAGYGEQCVAAAGHFPQASADDENQVRAAHALRQRGIDPDADISAIVRMPIVEQILSAETTRSREIIGFDERADIIAGTCGPVAAAENDKRFLR